MTKYQILKDAVLEGKSIRFNYQKLPRVCSPHTIGRTDGKERLLAYQYGGASSKGLPQNGQWRCFDIEAITDLQLTNDGEWKTGDSHTRPQTCVKLVDAEWRQA